MPIYLLALAVLLAFASALSTDRVLSLWLAACAGAPVGVLIFAACTRIPNR